MFGRKYKKQIAELEVKMQELQNDLCKDEQLIAQLREVNKVCKNTIEELKAKLAAKAARATTKKTTTKKGA